MNLTTQPMNTAKRPAIQPAASRMLQRCGGAQCPPGTCDHDRLAPDRTTIASTRAGMSPSPSHEFGRVRIHRVAKADLADEMVSAQPTLEVGALGDSYEQEADRVAEMVLAASPPRPELQETPSHVQDPHLQRACTGCDEDEHGQPLDLEAEGILQSSVARSGDVKHFGVPESQIERLRGDGRPLPGSVRAYFESRFGYDFGAVRVHTGAEAAQVSQSMHALAFTIGTDVAFGAGRYSPETSSGRRLLAHELTHVVQQGGAGPRPAAVSYVEQPAVASHVEGVAQRAGDPAAIPAGLRCPTDLTPGRPAGTDLLFAVGGSAITPVHTVQLTTVLAAWLTSGGTDDILVHGFASTEGAQGANWTLSCDRAEAVRAELVRLGIPAVRISVVAHGETTDFGAGRDPNQRAVVTTRGGGIFPLVGGALTARDNFAGRSTTRFGVGELIDLSFFSFPVSPAAGFGGLQWHLVSGGGALAATGGPNAGTATYTAPATAGPVQLELRVASGATAGRVISSHAITIVIPNGVRMTDVPGTAPDFAGTILPGTWGAGFRANPFINPRDVSFGAVLFGEGTVAGVVTPAGSFLSARHGIVHAIGGLVPAGGGNAATGTPILGVDSIATAGGVSPRSVLGVNICGASDFLWAIPWEFSVAGSPRTPFATANHHVTSTFFCNATIEKSGAGPFCRSIDGTPC